MAEKTLNTVIVLRNDKSTDWADSDVILREGELGVSYIYNDDGITVKNVVVKAGNGADKWAQLKQVEGVFEQPVTLTQDFGYFTGVPKGGYKTFAETAGMTTSEFLLSALKKTVEPTIKQPSASISASAVVENNDAEIGAYITGLKWSGSTSNGSYIVGSGSDQGTGISNKNFTFSVSNNIDSQTATDTDGSFGGTFTLTSDKYIQINSDASSIYATITADISLDVSGAKDPKNNLGETTTGKITAASCGTPWNDKTANISVTGYRKPFWGVISAADFVKNATEFTSADVRALPKNGTSAKSFPNALNVPAGSQMVVFFAQAGKYSSLTATDDKAMNAGVTFTKVANATRVKGAHDFVTSSEGDAANGELYDLWYVNWGAGIGSEKQLTLVWG